MNTEERIMNIMYVSPDNKNWSKYEINAKHKWGMPGINCSECGQTWAMVGVSYPMVDLSGSPHENEFKPWPVSVEKYRELMEIVRPLLPKGLVIPPGTTFGPLIGKAEGEFGDFTWLNPWTLLIHKNFHSKLSSLGLKLPGIAKPEISVKHKKSFDYYEFQIEARATLSPNSFSSSVRPCSLCGRVSEKPNKMIIEEGSIPTDVDIFRIKDFPTHIIVSEKFVEIVKSLNLSNILFMGIDNSI